MSKKVALVTGASSGMGAATAKKLAEQGVVVYGAARRVERMSELEKVGIKTLKLDLTDDKSIEATIKMIIKNEGRIDILVNNAGYGSYGPIEEVPIEEARRQFEVNIFGLARITQLVLPHMRKQQSGRIVNISSMGGKIYTPLGGWYHATKFALEGWSDCLRVETKQFGIEVVVVEPGGVATEWGDIAMDNLRSVAADTAYQSMANTLADASAGMKPKLTPADELGETIAHASLTENPKTRYVKGYLAKPILNMRKLMSDKMFDKAIMREVDRQKAA